MAPEGREQDAEAVVDALSRKHGLRVDGEPPRHRIEFDIPEGQAFHSGSLPDPLRTLLVDLVYDGAVKNLAMGWTADGAPLPADPPERLEIGDFLAASRDRRLRAGRWYRIHAPAGYRCRPRGQA